MAASNPRPIPVGPSALRVLLIEDNPDDFALIEAMVDDLETSISLDWVERLSEGLERLEEGAYDAILLDMSLPDSEGLETVAEVKGAVSDIPIIALTGREDEEFAMQVVQHGAQDYLLKGQIDGDLLLRALRYGIERMRGEERLRQAQKMEAIGLLAGGVAHDFNNLLTVINGASELGMGDVDETHPAYRQFRAIHDAGERAASLTQQLLTFSRQHMLRPEVVGLNAVIENTVDMLQRLIGEDIELLFEPTNDLGLVEVDPGQVEQIIMNLAVNARDAMPDGGRLVIETSNVQLDDGDSLPNADIQPGSYVKISFSDTGEGMDAAIQDRVFEPYFTTKSLGQGTGLGLATVHGIVEESKGYISVYSEPGIGTTFRIYLPVLESDEELPPAAEASVEHPTGTETILVVEDQGPVLGMTEQMLAMHGYEVLSAQTLQDVTERFDERCADIALLLTDVVMPEIKGPQLAERLRARRPGLKVLFMSGYSKDAVTGQSLVATDSNFIEKPFSVADLLARVRAVLDDPGADGAGP